jgi:dCMP deaminase
MIIGITGTLGAGKGTVVEFLKQNGFSHFSVREYLNEELMKRGLPLSRDNQVIIANQLRELNSSEYIVKKLFEKAKIEGKNSIIESIRTQGEAELIKKEGGYLLSVDADPKIRYSRIILRHSETDNISFDEFLENEKREMFSINPNHQNLRKCIQMADFSIENDKDIEHLKKQIGEIYRKILEKEKLTSTEKTPEQKEIHKRPSWDEYFIGIMDAVSKRATCDRGKSGCVVAKDKHILVTGYVGSPVGIPHCDEIGHQLKKTIHEDGTISQHCVRTAHSEQNAICQAAKLGIALNGATLYCKMTPCYTCAKMIINSGIKRVVCEKGYHQGKESEDIFKQAGILLEILDDEVEKYENM